jgi:Holliday junction DNA helicase RuvB
MTTAGEGLRPECPQLRRVCFHVGASEVADQAEGEWEKKGESDATWGLLSHAAGANLLPMSERTQITTPDSLEEDRQSEPTLRPQRLSEFIGQAKVREALSIAIQAAKQRREPLDHILFHGPPGLGKTTLASLLAREMGVNFKTTSGPILEKPADLVGILTNQREGDILFIDEIHRLRPIIEEFLYPAMEDWQIEIRLSDGPKAQTMTMKIERFTLVGATTRFGLLTAPMRARFGIVQRLNFYPPGELATIIRRSSEILDVEATTEGADELAKRSRGTPRVANRLLRRVRDYAQVRGDGVIDEATAGAGLQMLDVDEYGLDEMDARVLKTLIEKFEGGPVGLNSLAVAMGEDATTLEEVYEPFLIMEGFLMRTPQGRVATPRAFRRFGYSIKEPGAKGDQASLFEKG